MRSADRCSAAWTLPQSPYSRHTQLHASASDRLGTAGCSSDHIASDYNKHGGGSLPDGTGVIGLLLIKKGAGAGAYEHYHLGSGRATYGYTVNDAYAVHDQMLWLPIGLAYAR